MEKPVYLLITNRHIMTKTSRILLCQAGSKTEDKISYIPSGGGYQPVGAAVDLSKVKPPRQETAAQKPKK